MSKSSIPFIKMQGAGNDFILMDNRSLKLSEEYLTELAPSICNRKFGIGSDGLITLNYDEKKKADLVMLYKNPDGSDAGMCGNGARCFAAYAVTLGSPKEFTFRVHDHIYRANVKKSGVTISFPLETTVDAIDLEGYNAYSVYTNTEHIVCPVAPEQLEEEPMLV
ncbi:MAG: diaminopimelate epimerase, partial [Balneolaceae bacterium]|nr:diaminopimelate epimerase [Balneolaceae bacterium]